YNSLNGCCCPQEISNINQAFNEIQHILNNFINKYLEELSYKKCEADEDIVCYNDWKLRKKKLYGYYTDVVKIVSVANNYKD
ncbi:hypothetical protein PVNG_03105, partial [Plasmodium vivax North Korean]